MKPGEQFEIRCYEYLKNMYETKNGTMFHLEGGMDSTKSDIAVIKNGYIDYFIEVKDNPAQSGQFVLLPNADKKTFLFSPKNHSKPNEMTYIIIEYMNRNFDRFSRAGTGGESLKIDSSVFSEWIIRHYKEKNVKYIISYKDDYVIFPIRKFAAYFDIFATYRIKKSGSGNPAKKDIPIVKQTVVHAYPFSTFWVTDKKLFVEISEPITEDRFVLGEYTYYLSQQETGLYEIRRLSNTYHQNVIFSIHLKKSQDLSDLAEFESNL